MRAALLPAQTRPAPRGRRALAGLFLFVALAGPWARPAVAGRTAVQQRFAEACFIALEELTAQDGPEDDDRRREILAAAGLHLVWAINKGDKGPLAGFVPAPTEPGPPDGTFQVLPELRERLDKGIVKYAREKVRRTKGRARTNSEAVEDVAVPGAVEPAPSPLHPMLRSHPEMFRWPIILAALRDGRNPVGFAAELEAGDIPGLTDAVEALWTRVKDQKSLRSSVANGTKRTRERLLNMYGATLQQVPGLLLQVVLLFAVAAGVTGAYASARPADPAEDVARGEARQQKAVTRARAEEQARQKKATERTRQWEAEQVRKEKIAELARRLEAAEREAVERERARASAHMYEVRPRK